MSGLKVGVAGSGIYTRWSKAGVLHNNLLIMEGMARDGYTMDLIANRLNISEKSLKNLAENYGDVRKALANGKLVINYAVENALLKKALGGDVSAIRLWLTNQSADKWKSSPDVVSVDPKSYVNIDFSGLVQAFDKGDDSDS